MDEYRKPRHMLEVFAFDQASLARKRRLIYLLQFLLPAVLVASVIIFGNKAQAPVGKDHPMLLPLMISACVITVIELGLIGISILMTGRLENLELRIGKQIIRSDGRRSETIALKDVARMIVTELPCGRICSIELRNLGPTMRLAGFEDMDRLRSTLEARIPDRRGRVQIVSTKVDAHRVKMLVTVFVLVAAVLATAASIASGHYWHISRPLLFAAGLAVLMIRPITSWAGRSASLLRVIVGSVLIVAATLLILIQMAQN